MDTGQYSIVDGLTGFETHNIPTVPIKSLDEKEVMGAIQVVWVGIRYRAT